MSRQRALEAEEYISPIVVGCYQHHAAACLRVGCLLGRSGSVDDDSLAQLIKPQKNNHLPHLQWYKVQWYCGVLTVLPVRW